MWVRHSLANTLELEDLCSGAAFSLGTGRAGCMDVPPYLSDPVSSLKWNNDASLNDLPGWPGENI